MSLFASPVTIAQLAMLGFFTILFLQSGLDKVQDRKGNLAWLEPHFANSPFRGKVSSLLTVLTIFELASGVACIAAFVFSAIALARRIGISESQVQIDLWSDAAQRSNNWALGASCVVLATFLQLFLGQRLAKDYAGAAGLVPYFFVAIFLAYSSQVHAPFVP